MGAWTKALEQLGYLLLGNPRSGLEMGVILVLAVLTLLFVLTKAGSAFGISNTGIWYSLIIGILGVVILMAVMVAARRYLPLWKTESLRIWILVGAGLLASLLLVLPLICGIQRTGYLSALLTWFTAVASVAVVIALVGLVFDGLAAGSRSAGKGAERKQQVESFTK